MIPKDWHEEYLGNGIELISGQHISAKDYTDDPPGIPYLTGPADFPNGEIIVTKYTQKPKKLCQTGDILLTVKGSGTGKIIRANDEYCISRQLMAIRPTKWNSDFVYYYLSRNNQRYEDNAAGLIPGITREDVLKSPIQVPPLAEQKAIAQILGTWDEAIAVTEALIEALTLRKRALMQCLLTGEVRFPGFDEEWEEVKLGDVVKPVNRLDAIEPDKQYRMVGVRWYLEGVHIHDVLYGSEISTPKLSRVRQNDIMYNKMWVTKDAFGIAHSEHEGAYSSSEYPQFVAKHNLVTEYMEYAFHNERFLYDAKTLCRGTTGRARLNPSDFVKLGMNLPSVSEQTSIADLLKTIDHEIAHTQKYHVYLQEQKRGLMQVLLTGQVRVEV